MCYSEQGGSRMQKYEKPNIELVELEKMDVIRTSFGGSWSGEGGSGGGPWDE